MNYKNIDLLKRMMNYMIKQSDFEVDEEAMWIVLNHCFKRKNENGKNYYRVEWMIHDKDKSWFNHSYTNGCQHAYYYEKYHVSKDNLDLPEKVVKTIDYTINTLITAPWVNNLINQFKTNATEAFKYYKSSK